MDDEGVVQYAFEYQYDGAHNRTVKVDGGTPTCYTYNAANQLLTETTGEQTIYYQYDGCGNTVAKQETAGTTYYIYDTENLMTRIDFPDESHAYYTYDADSTRVSQRTADGYARFIYQGPDMLKLQMERDEDGETAVHYTMGNGLATMRRANGGGIGAGASSFYHYNHLGTTIALTGANESVTDTYRHDAWGVLLAGTGTTPNPHTYVGRERYYRMPTAGLYHLGFRDYGQRAGRFLTVDPVPWPPPGMSLRLWPRRLVELEWQDRLVSAALAPYAYTRNRASARLDPAGLWDCAPCYAELWPDDPDARDIIRACWNDCQRGREACQKCIAEKAREMGKQIIKDAICGFFACCWLEHPRHTEGDCSELTVGYCEDCCEYDMVKEMMCRNPLSWAGIVEKEEACAVCCLE